MNRWLVDLTLGLALGLAWASTTHALGDPNPNARLTVVKVVDYGQSPDTRTACDFFFQVDVVETSGGLVRHVAGFPAAQCTTPGHPGTATTNVDIAGEPSIRRFRISESLPAPNPPAWRYMSVFSGDCDRFGQVAIGAGEHKTCTVTNANAPEGPAGADAVLTVVKIVDHGQSPDTRTACDFFFDVDLVDVVSGHTLASVAGFPAAQCVTPGPSGPLTATTHVGVIGQPSTNRFRISESLPAPSPPAWRYVPAFGGDCDRFGQVAIGAGEHKTCTVTNANAPDGPSGANAVLTVVKTVDYGNLTDPQSRDACDFDFDVDLVSASSGQILASVAGFRAARIGCDSTPGPRTATTHVGVVGQLTNLFRISEGLPASGSGSRYLPTFDGDCDVSGLVAVRPGEQKTCLVTNTLLAPESASTVNALLTVTKVVDPAGIGDSAFRDACDAALAVAQKNTPTSFQQIASFPGTRSSACASPAPVLLGTTNLGVLIGSIGLTQIFRVSEPSPAPGYFATFGGDCDATGLVTVHIGEHRTCAVTNRLNTPPFFDPIADRAVDEDAPTQGVTIAGVRSGAPGEPTQPLTFTATSSNPAVVPNPTVTGSGTTRTLTFTPLPGTSGSVDMTVAANDGQSLYHTFSRTFKVTVNRVDDADVSVTVTDSPDPVGRSRQLTYSMTVVNNGPEDARNPIVVSNLPPGTTFASITLPAGATATTPATGSGGQVRATLGLIRPGDKASLQLVINVLKEASSPLNLTATVSNSAQDPNTSNNTATVSTKVVDVGTFVIEPPHTSLAVGERVKLSLTWTVPDGRWRELKKVHLRAQDRLGILFWVRFDEASNTLALHRDGGFGPAKAPGSASLLSNHGATVHLDGCTVQGSGPTGPSVTLILDVSLKKAAAGGAFTLELKASDDLGNTQDWAPAGTLTVGRAP